MAGSIDEPNMAMAMPIASNSPRGVEQFVVRTEQVVEQPGGVAREIDAVIC